MMDSLLQELEGFALVWRDTSASAGNFKLNVKTRFDLP